MTIITGLAVDRITSNTTDCRSLDRYLDPPDLLNALPLENPDRQWWVLYTKSRQEKALAAALFAREIPFYLPLVRKGSVTNGRRHESRVPMFGGYMFLFGDPQERLTALQTNRISQVLEVTEGPRLRAELKHLQTLIQSELPLTLESRIEPGQYVRIKNGPLAGVEGMVLNRRGKQRLLIAVNYMQQGASVELEDFQVELI